MKTLTFLTITRKKYCKFNTKDDFQHLGLPKDMSTFHCAKSPCETVLSREAIRVRNALKFLQR